MKENTVFILGAGASMPYGFPSGLELKKMIVYLLHEIIERNKVSPAIPKSKTVQVLKQNEKVKIDITLKNIKKDIKANWDHTKLFSNLNSNYKHLFTCIRENKHMQTHVLNGIDQVDILTQNFFKKFFFSGTNSIDSFLTRNRDYDEIGKILLLYLLTDCEKYSNLYKFYNSWYNYFFNNICNQNLVNIKKDKCTFITFNYDRSFEEYMLIVHSELHNIERTSDVLNIIPVYGNLGDLSRIEYGKGLLDLNEDETRYAINRISFIRENDVDSDNDSEMKEQREIISKKINNADRLIILGFGFDDANMKLLFSGTKFDKSKTEKEIIANNCPVVFTSKGLTEVELGRLRNKYKFLKEIKDDKGEVMHQAQTDSEWTNYDLLRNSELFQTFLE